MRKVTAIWGTGLFLVIVPCTMAGLVPWWITNWQFQPAFLGWETSRIIGALILLVGISGLLDSFGRFAIQGLGTPAPLAPPRNLVVTGLYRHVRNPMYVSVIAIIVGQALLLGDWRLMAYTALFWFATHLFIVFHEEPTLAQSFGKSYAVYCANVPRWVPRIASWRGRGEFY